MHRVKYWEIIPDNLSKAGWSWGCVHQCARAASKAPALQTGLRRTAFPPLAKTALVFVRLDYSAGVIKHADNCPVRAREGAVLHVGDRFADRVGSCIPDRAASKAIAD